MVAVLSHQIRSRKKRRFLAMGVQETVEFYWEQFQLMFGMKIPEIQEEPDVILPPVSWEN